MEKAKYGKLRQVNAVNGSQMVVKIGVFYYRGFLHNYTISGGFGQQLEERRIASPLFSIDSNMHPAAL